MKPIRDLFRMLSTEYGMTFLISGHILSEMERIADTIGIISRGNQSPFIMRVDTRHVSPLEK